MLPVRAGSAPEVTRHARTVGYVDHAMGMPVSLAMRGNHAADAAGLAGWGEVMESLHGVDRVFSTFRHDSYVSRLGRGELRIDECPAEVAEVLRLGSAAEVATDGAFAVRRPGPGGSAVFDPSGVVKGWAVQRAAVHLEGLEGTDFCLSAGGDMVCRTLHPRAPGWRIGVEDPHDPSHLVAVVPVRTGAVATSSAAHRGTHIVDARTGAPPSGVAAVTVVGPSLTWADIEATSAFTQGERAAGWLRTRGATGLVVWVDGSTTLVGGP